MKSRTIIYIRWKISNRFDIFTNLGKLFDEYDSDQIGISRYTLNKKDLFDGFENDKVEIKKCYIKQHFFILIITFS